LMNKKSAFLLLLLSTVLFFSCKKEKSPEEIPGMNANRVKSYTIDYTGPLGRSVFTYNFSYDDKNRISMITVSENPDSKTIYEYHSTDSYSMKEYQGGRLSIYVTYFLKNVKVDSLVSIVNTNDSVSAKFHYDARNL